MKVYLVQHVRTLVITNFKLRTQPLGSKAIDSTGWFPCGEFLVRPLQMYILTRRRP